MVKRIKEEKDSLYAPFDGNNGCPEIMADILAHMEADLDPVAERTNYLAFSGLHTSHDGPKNNYISFSAPS